MLVLGVLSCLALSLVFAMPLPPLGGSGDDPETPGAAALEAACGSRVEPLDFHIRDTLRLDGGAVILYDARCPSPVDDVAASRFAGAAVVQDLVRRSARIGGRVVWEDRYWSAHTEMFGDMPLLGEGLPPVARGPLISYEPWGASGWSEGIGRHEYVSGRVLAPERVAAVETVLGDGSIARGGVDRGVWVLFALESGGIREVRALDRDGMVLQ